MDGVDDASVLITGSSGHLGEALLRVLRDDAAGLSAEVRAAAHALAVSVNGDQAMTRPLRAVGIDVIEGPMTNEIVDITDRETLRGVFDRHRVRAVIHTATLHKPHVETHTRQQFIDVNVSGSLNLMEIATEFGVQAFVLTSTTSVYSKSIEKHANGGSSLWVDEDTTPCAKNIYGITKLTAEGLAGLLMRLHNLPVVVVRLSRFFQEADDEPEARKRYADANLKLNELLYRRADVEDMAQACLLAAAKAQAVVQAHRLTPEGKSSAPTFIISSPTLFVRSEVSQLTAADSIRALVLQHSTCASDVETLYAANGWRLPDELDRVYDGSRAVRMLGWKPQYTFDAMVRRVLALQQAGSFDPHSSVMGSELAAAVGRKTYHSRLAQAAYP
jgi:UDP-glucose 4-epimerase